MSLLSGYTEHLLTTLTLSPGEPTYRSCHDAVTTGRDSAARLSEFDPSLCQLPAVYPGQAT